MGKRNKIIAFIIIALILFVPFHTNHYDDGGTTEHFALTYRMVKWNRIVSSYDKDEAIEQIDTYRDTSVYWFPNNFKTIDELWEMENHD